MLEIRLKINRRLLEDLDRFAAQKRTGRSAVVHAAPKEFLKSAKAADITRRYEEGYSSTNGWTAEELEWLEDEGELAEE